MFKVILNRNQKTAAKAWLSSWVYGSDSLSKDEDRLAVLRRKIYLT